MSLYDEVFGRDDHVDEMAGRLLGYWRGELTMDDRRTVDEHLRECAACRLAVVNLEETEREVIERLWEEHRLSDRVAAARGIDLATKREILRARRLWPGEAAK